MGRAEGVSSGAGPPRSDRRQKTRKVQTSAAGKRQVVYVIIRQRVIPGFYTAPGFIALICVKSFDFSCYGPQSINTGTGGNQRPDRARGDVGLADTSLQQHLRTHIAHANIKVNPDIQKRAYRVDTRFQKCP